jgi:hypothetical protein
MQTFNVLLTFRFPSWDYKRGVPFEVQASSKSEAIKQARKQAERDGHVPMRGMGKATFTATLAN